MARAFGERTLWHYSHSTAIFFSVLLFTAGFLCVLLWTNNFVRTPTSVSDPSVSTFTQFSPAVSTFKITYDVALFGAAWNSIVFVILLLLEQDALPLSTERLRWEIERAACIISVVGNAVYSTACIALMATLARLAADAGSEHSSMPTNQAAQIAADAMSRRAGQGVTAAMAGLAAATAVWACVMDTLHGVGSTHRAATRYDVVQGGGAAGGPDPHKQA